MNRIFELIYRFFQVGLLSIGGGYAALPLIQKQMVEEAGWLTMQEFTDIITISQMTPGPLAVNATTFAGMRAGGIPGAIAATISCIISGVIISLLLHRVFHKNAAPASADILKALRSASAGLIFSASAAILVLALFDGKTPNLNTLDFYSFAIACCCFLLLRRKKKPNTLAVMFFSGGLGVLFRLVL